MIFHDEHELANAIRSLCDIDRADEFVGASASNDIIIHIVLNEGIIAIPANHRVKPFAAIEVVIASAAIDVVATKITDDAVKELLSAGIGGSRGVEIRAGVEIRRVAEERVVALITNQGILATHAKQKSGGFPGEQGVAESIANAIDSVAEHLKVLDTIEGSDVSGGKGWSLLPRWRVVGLVGLELLQGIAALDRVEIEIGANEIGAAIKAGDFFNHPVFTIVYDIGIIAKAAIHRVLS